MARHLAELRAAGDTEERATTEVRLEALALMRPELRAIGADAGMRELTPAEDDEESVERARGIEAET